MPRLAELIVTKDGRAEEVAAQYLSEIEVEDNEFSRYSFSHFQHQVRDPESPSMQILQAVHAYMWQNSVYDPNLPTPYTHVSTLWLTEAVRGALGTNLLKDNEIKALTGGVLGTLSRAKLMWKPGSGKSRQVFLRSWDSSAIEKFYSTGNVPPPDWRTEQRIEEEADKPVHVTFEETVIQPLTDFTTDGIKAWAADTIERQKKLMRRLNRQLDYTEHLERQIEEMSEKIEAMGGEQFAEVAEDINAMLAGLNGGEST